MGDTGLEVPPFSSGKSKIAEPTGNKSGNTDARLGDRKGEGMPGDPELAALISAWPELPQPLRAGIAAMVRSVCPSSCADGVGPAAGTVSDVRKTAT